jgi:DNA-binding MltR family transcriptional regulator
LIGPVLAFIDGSRDNPGMAKESHPTIEQLGSESKELYELLSTEADFPCVVVSLSFIDQCLASLLHRFFIDGSTADRLLDHRGALGSFIARVDLSYCLGLITKELFQNLHVLGEIRNVFAHSRFKLSFDSPRIKDLCELLTFPKAKGLTVNTDTCESRQTTDWPQFFYDTPRRRFILIVTLIASRLLVEDFSGQKRLRKTGREPVDVVVTGPPEHLPPA